MRSIRKLEAMKLDHDEEEKADRRFGIERRKFSYSAHIPERRTGPRRRKPDEPCLPPDDMKAEAKEE